MAQNSQLQFPLYRPATEFRELCGRSVQEKLSTWGTRMHCRSIPLLIKKKGKKREAAAAITLQRQPLVVAAVAPGGGLEEGTAEAATAAALRHRHPLYTGFAKRIGASMSEATMRPHPRQGRLHPAAADRQQREPRPWDRAHAAHVHGAVRPDLQDCGHIVRDLGQLPRRGGGRGGPRPAAARQGR